MSLTLYIAKVNNSTINNVIIGTHDIFFRMSDGVRTCESKIYLVEGDVVASHIKKLSNYDIIKDPKYCEVISMELKESENLYTVLENSGYSGNLVTFFKLAIQQITTLSTNKLNAIHNKNNITSIDIMETGVWEEVRKFFNNIHPRVWSSDQDYDYIEFNKYISTKSNNNNLSFSANSSSIKILQTNSSNFTLTDEKILKSMLKYSKEYITKNNLRLVLSPINWISSDYGKYIKFALIQINNEENQELYKKIIKSNADMDVKQEIEFMMDGLKVYNNGAVDTDKVFNIAGTLAKIVSITNLGGYGLYAAYFLLGKIAYEDWKNNQ